jgi:hypothetical protein
MSSALQMIGSSVGIPELVLGVPFAQPGAGIGTPVPPSWTTLELPVWLGACPEHAVEVSFDVAALAT